MKDTDRLLHQLLAYSQQGCYPFHMPGHKRQNLTFPNPWTMDITEINGFDNLHHPEGLIKKLQERTARLFQSQKSFCLVNGSTCGILAAVSACVAPGRKLLMSRNCHKSTYHSVYLRDITPVYLMPEMTSFGILGSLSPQALSQALEENPDAAAVFVVSPTYDGIVSDIRSIADITHERNIPLIVDEAHGAHFSLSDDFPSSAITCGADIVIQSLHKTLPSFTQTALLHLNSSLVEEGKLRRFLEIYQTSSPSYLLMASVDQCLEILETEGTLLFRQLKENLTQFYDDSRLWSHLSLFDGKKESPVCLFDWDNSKILISAQNMGYSGQKLSSLLRTEYHIEVEMAAGHYALALSSLMDTSEGFLRLSKALSEIDRSSPLSFPQKHVDIINDRTLYKIPKQVMTIAEAMNKEGTFVPLQEASGNISREFLYLYPPGIPLLTPGERISDTLLFHLKKLEELELYPQGLSDMTNQRINIVNF